jgi:hypothetical protein
VSSDRAGTRSYLGQVEFGDHAGLTRGAIECRVVNADEDAVARQMEIGLDDIGPIGDRTAKGRQRVLRRRHAVAAMRHDVGPGLAIERVPHLSTGSPPYYRESTISRRARM